jgi:hypothetical protein
LQKSAFLVLEKSRGLVQTSFQQSAIVSKQPAASGKTTSGNLRITILWTSSFQEAFGGAKKLEAFGLRGFEFLLCHQQRAIVGARFHIKPFQAISCAGSKPLTIESG